MEMAGCIPIFSKFFLHLLSTYTNLLHLLSSNQSFSCFLQLVPSISSLIDAVYVFHPLYVALPSFKYLPQVVSNHHHTTSHHSPLPAYLLLPLIPASQDLFLPQCALHYFSWNSIKSFL